MGPNAAVHLLLLQTQQLFRERPPALGCVIVVHEAAVAAETANGGLRGQVAVGLQRRQAMRTTTPRTGAADRRSRPGNLSHSVTALSLCPLIVPSHCAQSHKAVGQCSGTQTARPLAIARRASGHLHLGLCRLVAA
jgi:hypothetical protein